ncbi:hypothetical protein SAMN05421780_11049 [Flexibacter flexilis DSM 6793]|uniref:Uncharacterized protein n=1 Tax=Flexibacter flexilis DSM 6793 TaxID=927664 RepID=A0A1I1MCW5_9BACT|nr:hypothetical protein [Flexibacter flexilis]SFC80928.1 hypothetical protein SAMN05421780_11049 [Flexibacter flexilis DSM 6793]
MYNPSQLKQLALETIGGSAISGEFDIRPIEGTANFTVHCDPSQIVDTTLYTLLKEVAAGLKKVRDNKLFSAKQINPSGAAIQNATINFFESGDIIRPGITNVQGNKISSTEPCIIYSMSLLTAEQAADNVAIGDYNVADASVLNGLVDLTAGDSKAVKDLSARLFHTVPNSPNPAGTHYFTSPMLAKAGTDLGVTLRIVSSSIPAHLVGRVDLGILFLG